MGGGTGSGLGTSILSILKVLELALIFQPLKQQHGLLQKGAPRQIKNLCSNGKLLLRLMLK